MQPNTTEVWEVNIDPRFDNGNPYTIWGLEGPGRGAIAHLKPWCAVTSREEHYELARRAHLIAAAPEMLKALKTLEPLWPAHHREGGKCVKGYCYRCYLEALVAKAEGAPLWLRWKGDE